MIIAAGSRFRRVYRLQFNTIMFPFETSQ